MSITPSGNNVPSFVQRVNDLADRAAANHPQLAARAWRAADIVLAGECHQVGQCTYICHGYTVHIGPTSCDCPDYQFGGAPLSKAGKRTCKHIIAALMCATIADETPKPANVYNLHADAARTWTRIAAAKSGHPFV